MVYIEPRDTNIYASGGPRYGCGDYKADWVTFKFVDLNGWLSGHPEVKSVADEIRRIDSSGERPFRLYTKFGWQRHREDDEFYRLSKPGIVGNFLFLYDGDVECDKYSSPIEGKERPNSLQ